ncbi:hypothetical protein EW145_g7423, partial [Phellinidium pouzarii]
MEDSSQSTTATVVQDGDQSPNNLELEAAHELYPGPEVQEKDPFLVEFEPDDPLNPMRIIGPKCIICFFGTVRRSFKPDRSIRIFRGGCDAHRFTLRFWLLCRAIVLGPALRAVGCALSKNTASILIFRLLGGIFAAAPLTNSGALMADIWDAGTRGKAAAMFTVAPFAGPALGPLVGGYISTSGTSWRWLFWVLTMFAGSCLICIILFLPETYAPVIMISKAKALRLKTGDDGYRAPLENTEEESFARKLNNIVARPFRILIEEPMLIAITVYMSFVYGCLYLLFEAFPIVFTEGHHFSAGASGLMFLPLFVGAAGAVVFYLLLFDPRYERLIEVYKPNPVPPEYRLEVAIVGAPVFAISFFWFGWTSFPSISYWAPMLAGGGIGLSVVLIFLPLINYIIDSYLFLAASALAANTVVRSLFGAAFPLFATQMYDALNPRWASTLIGCVAVIMIPIPLLLKRSGVGSTKKQALDHITDLSVDDSYIRDLLKVVGAMDTIDTLRKDPAIWINYGFSLQSSSRKALASLADVQVNTLVQKIETA